MPESTTTSKPDLLDFATRVAGWANDGEQLDVYVARGRDTEVRVYKGEIEQLSTADAEGVGIRVVKDGRTGFAYAGTLDDDAVAEALADARDNAEFGTPDEFAGVASPDGVEARDIDPYDPDIESFPTDKKIELALELERMVNGADERIAGARVIAYGDEFVERAVATSLGVSNWSRRSAASVQAYVIARDGDDTQTGGGYSAGRSATTLDLERAANDAVEHAIRMLGATKPKSAKVVAVLEPSIAATFLGLVGGTLAGSAVLKGRSLFADRVGEEVAAPAITLIEDPTLPEAWGATKFDGEGLATRPVTLIDNGVLQGYLYDTYSARRAGTAPTGSGVRGGFKGTPGVGHRALRLVPGERSQEEIIKGIDDGVLVQSVSGLHSGVNPVSGDFSVGATGIRIRNGELAEPIREFTIGSTIQRMLKGITAVGNDLEWMAGSSAHITLAMSDISLAGI
ncbi:MAG TPA: TldD/PmbA family protein [Acidimicrobiales bacterium]|nr:TldD/PmbA family protein [Acidimicrobiales bacterium]